jgi:Pyruvate/2-oxoacid:ferredoxin oxidoreductase delta subunit
MNDIETPAGKTWFVELHEAVIDAGRCIPCGTCVTSRPADSIGVGEDGLPELLEMCTGCSLCWDCCPRGGLRDEPQWKITVGSVGSWAGTRRRPSRVSSAASTPTHPGSSTKPTTPGSGTTLNPPSRATEPNHSSATRAE